MSRKLGRYHLLDRLGAGGMGEVYRARDAELGREVAVKLLPPHLAQDPEALARFRREARAVAALSHPNIMAIFDFGHVEGVAFAVMELLQGDTLRARLERGPLPWRQAAEVAVEIAAGLAAAHAHGITHRDLKPENLFLTTEGRLKILDFGLAGVHASPGGESSRTVTLEPTQPGTVMGTVGYMSPEQVRGEPVGPASDLFSLGCVLHEMIAGQRAFVRKTGAETLAAILRDEPPPLGRTLAGLPEDLEAILRRCLAKEPAQRFATAHELETELGRLLAARERRSSKLLSRTVRLTALGLAAVTAIALGARFVLRSMGNGKLDSLAIVPVANASTDAELEYLSEGISASISHSLSQLSTLKVMSQNSVARFKGQEVDARIAGQQLGVRAIVLGRVSLQGDVLTINVELVDTKDRRLLWGESYTRRDEDVLVVQAEIAKEIADKLRLRLSAPEEQRLTKQPTRNPEAYRLYLQGRFHSLQWTTEGWRRGIELMQQAVELDPSYALAYAGLAASYYDAAGQWLPPDVANSKAKAAAERALELDDTLAEAHGALAQVLAQYEWNWAEAEKQYLRAIELNPSYAQAHQYHGIWLLEQGRADEAIAAMKRAQELDPLTPLIEANLAYCYYMARQYDETIRCSRALIQSHSDLPIGHYNLGIACAQLGLYDEALAALRTAQALDPSSQHIVSLLGHTYAQAGKRQDALHAVDELEEIAKHRYVDPFGFARIQAGLGDNEAALARLEEAYTIRSEELCFLKLDPHFDGLRTEPRFIALMRRLGLGS